VNLPDFLKKYPHTIEDIGDCYFYKIRMGTISINIQEDKEGEYHFFSIWKGEVSVISGWSNDMNKIYEDIIKNAGIKESKEKWNLFLDDVRTPKTDRDFIVARSVKEAIQLIRDKGFPSYMSLDHDLGEDVPTGHDFVKWIVTEYQDDILPEFTFNVHSANPVGKENMESLLNNFIKHKKTE